MEHAARSRPHVLIGHACHVAFVAIIKASVLSFASIMVRSGAGLWRPDPLVMEAIDKQLLHVALLHQVVRLQRHLHPSRRAPCMLACTRCQGPQPQVQDLASSHCAQRCCAASGHCAAQCDYSYATARRERERKRPTGQALWRASWPLRAPPAARCRGTRAGPGGR